MNSDEIQNKLFEIGQEFLGKPLTPQVIDQFEHHLNCFIASLLGDGITLVDKSGKVIESVQVIPVFEDNTLIN